MSEVRSLAGPKVFSRYKIIYLSTTLENGIIYNLSFWWKNGTVPKHLPTTIWGPPEVCGVAWMAISAFKWKIITWCGKVHFCVYAGVEMEKVWHCRHIGRSTKWCVDNAGRHHRCWVTILLIWLVSWVFLGVSNATAGWDSFFVHYRPQLSISFFHPV